MSRAQVGANSGHVRVLQRLTSRGIARPHLHRCHTWAPWPARRSTLAPAPADAVRSAGRLIACHIRRSRICDRRPALATRVVG